MLVLALFAVVEAQQPSFLPTELGDRSQPIEVQECHSGTWSCQAWENLAFEDDDDDDSARFCADYNNAYKKPRKMVGMVVFAAIVMCLMAFNIGANDVANAWATSVGSGAIGLARGTLIAGVANLVGAVALGSGVSTKVATAVSDIKDDSCWKCGYCDSRMTVYMLGMTTALVGASIFMLLATFTKMPVSTSHAIVGGIVGVTMAGVGSSCVDWTYGGMLGIVLSWVISPALSGLIAAGTYLGTKIAIIDSPDPLARARAFMPFLYGAVAFAMTLIVAIKSNGIKHLHLAEWVPYVAAACSGALALFVGIAVSLFTLADVRGLRTRADERALQKRQSVMNPIPFPGRSEDPERLFEMRASATFHDAFKAATEQDDIGDHAANVDVIRGKKVTDSVKDAIYCFKYVLVFNATLESFAHGANDTANSTAAFTAVYSTFKENLSNCSQKPTSVAIMFVGGLFICAGVYSLGYKVIETVGKNLTIVDFHTAWCTEFASTTTVVVATVLEMPVSTTHCQIGAVTAIGAVSLGVDKVNWSELGKIVVSWILTLPFAGMLAAVLMLMFRPALCSSCPWND
ncbi:hypothetical protein CTAYLR_004758 [Chrysophaeum taylorii]|uniref:Phosphate transporter n=1 Tax=Chrysophaeum taylorii TaxID=2483200 RepID=A0AAD7U7I5_9STRA|nr:hypothetical protein CTAYLR_004758 [Chrysophaeum taylorii]